MRILNAFILLLTLTIIAPAQQRRETIVPVATGAYLLGGAQDGRWLTPDAVAPSLGKRTAMVVIGLEGPGRPGAFLHHTGEENGACPENKLLRLEPETANLAVGANAGWSLVPRRPQSIAVTNQVFRRIAADFLLTKGLAKTKITLNQIVRIDLDGDGRREILITGNHYRRGNMEDQTPGDYSFALLRRSAAGGPAENILIEGEFFTKKDYYDPPNTREILAVADLNGDGRMEIVLDTHYYEGSWKQVFEFDGTKLAKVLEVSCLV